jgi:hypothetical protein
MGIMSRAAQKRIAIMKRVFVAVLAAACVAGSTPGFARGGGGHVGGFAHASGRGGFVRDPTRLLGSPTPRMPAFENRIPAPLAAPVQPPAINGPAARSPYGGVM